MKRRAFIQFTGAASIGAMTLPLVACDNRVTLAQIGPKIAPLVDIFLTELGSLKQAGVIAVAKYDQIIALDLPKKAKAIGDFLTGLTSITAGNKQEVIDKIKEGVDLFQALIGGVPVGSKAAKILAAITVTLDGARLAVVILNPPAAGIASAGQPQGISAKTVKVTLKPIDDEVKAALKAAGK